MLKEKQKNEAIKRLEKLNLHESVLREFKEENRLNISKTGGSLFWLNNEEKKIVNDFEEETKTLVYHVIYNKTEFGEFYTLFYVCKNEEEWYLDMEDLDNNICCAYVLNVTAKCLSKYGYIGFRRMIGGLIRIS